MSIFDTTNVLSRSLGFDAEKVKSDPYFMNLAKSVAGISDDHFGSLLSSVPVEMVFGDLRDACRRHAKQEVTTGCNIHSVVSRSCSHRIPSVETISPQGCDWSKPLAGKTLKRSVFDSSRCTDVSVGVTTSGLTRRKSITEFTKPHIFTQRLSLTQSLLKLWQMSDDFDVERTFKSLWISTLPERGLLLQKTGVDKMLLVVKGGPFSVRCIPLDTVMFGGQEIYMIEDPTHLVLAEIVVKDLDSFTFCASKPIISGEVPQICWVQSGEWMSIAKYVAVESILRVPAKSLAGLCSLLKLKGFTKLDYKGKVRLYLEHFDQPEERILSVLSQIPDKKPRARKSQEGEGEGENSEEDRIP